MIIPEIHLIFDSMFDLILSNFTFNFHIGTTPLAERAEQTSSRPGREKRRALRKSLTASAKFSLDRRPAVVVSLPALFILKNLKQLPLDGEGVSSEK